MTIKELEKEIREKITVLDKDELKKIIKYIDELCNDDVAKRMNGMSEEPSHTHEEIVELTK